MRIPSVKTLTAVFGSRAREARKLLERHGGNFCSRVEATDWEAYPATAAWIRSCYHPPTEHEAAMAALDEIAGTFGVEAIWSARSCTQPEAEYLNTGETYNTTLLYNFRSETFRVTSWGDFVEAAERRGIHFS